MKPTVARSSLVIWSLIAVMAVLIVFSIFARRSEPQLEPVLEKAYPVETLTLVPETLDDVLLLPGRIEPSLRANLPAVKPGRVEEILVDRGDVVTNDQLLLRIDARLWQANLDAAEIELREAEKELRRWNDLERAGAVSSSDMDQIRTRVDRARVQRDEALTHVAHCEIRSPADGVINERFIEVGEYATEGMAAFELVTTDPVKIRLDIPERDAVPLRNLGAMAFTVSVLPGQVFTGAITFGASASQAGNNAFRLELQAANPEGILMPGMIAEMRYRRGAIDRAIAVPLDAIIPLRGEQFVYLWENNRAVRRLVRMDRLVGSRAVIADGLAAGDRLVVRGNRALVDGVLLEEVAAVAAEPPP